MMCNLTLFSLSTTNRTSLSLLAPYFVARCYSIITILPQSYLHTISSDHNSFLHSIGPMVNTSYGSMSRLSCDHCCSYYLTVIMRPIVLNIHFFVSLFIQYTPIITCPNQSRKHYSLIQLHTSQHCDIPYIVIFFCTI